MIEKLSETQQRFLVDHFYSDTVVCSFDPLVIHKKGLTAALGDDIGSLLKEGIITIKDSIVTDTVVSVTFNIPKSSKQLLVKQSPGLVAIKYAIMGKAKELYDILPQVPKNELEKFREVRNDVIQERVSELLNAEDDVS